MENEHDGNCELCGQVGDMFSEIWIDWKPTVWADREVNIYHWVCSDCEDKIWQARYEAADPQLSGK